MLFFASVAVLLAGIGLVQTERAIADRLSVRLARDAPWPVETAGAPVEMSSYVALAASSGWRLEPGASAIAPPPEVFEGEVAAAEPLPVQLTDTAAPTGASRVFAVVIGIDDYPGSSSDLRSAGRDADDFVAALERLSVPAANVLSLRNGQATVGTILQAADWLASTAGPESTAVFFYAGHARKLDLTTEAIVGADGQLLTDTTLAQHLASTATSDVWLIMASCFGAGFTEALAPGRVLTAAAGADGLAYENDIFGRSYLGEFLVRQALLEGRAGEPTVQGVVAWAQAALTSRYPLRAMTTIDQSQHPISLDGLIREVLPPVSTTPPAPPPLLVPPQLIPLPPPTTLPPPAPMMPPTTAPPRNCFLVIFCSR